MSMINTSNNGTYLVCVSDREESQVALRYACLRAKKRGSSVALLHVAEPVDFQGMQMVLETMRAEKMDDAQNLVQQMAALAQQSTGITPQLLLREGHIDEEILAVTREFSDISVIVLGLAPNSDEGRKLMAWLAGQLGGALKIPVMLVPGNLTEEQLLSLV